MNHETREDWLVHAIALLWLRTPRLARTETDAELDLPRVSVGWPGGGSKRTRIGECWSNTASRDGRYTVFLSPVLEDPVTVLASLAHELVHCAVGLGAKHGPRFRAVAVEAGLVGKMTATEPGPGFVAWTTAALADLGPYPHVELAVFQRKPKAKPGEPGADPKDRTDPVTGRKVGGSRMVKCECPDCGYTVRAARSWLAQGAPLCPCHEPPVPMVPAITPADEDNP